LIIITKPAAEELLSMATEGKSVVLVLEASLDNEGGYDCSVNLAPEIPVGAEVEEIEGVKVAFCDEARAVFAGAVVGLTPEGELAIELAEGDCDCCGHGDDGCCDSGSCGSGGGCH